MYYITPAPLPVSPQSVPKNPDPWSVLAPYMHSTSPRDWSLFIPVTLDNVDVHFTSYVLKFLQNEDLLLPEFQHLPVVLHQFQDAFTRWIIGSLGTPGSRNINAVQHHLSDVMSIMKHQPSGLLASEVKSPVQAPDEVTWSLTYEYNIHDYFCCVDPSAQWMTSNHQMYNPFVHGNSWRHLRPSKRKANMALAFRWLI